ncbi:phage tail tape measure protein [Listeria monocytogenes]|nr:phage tail tape measure protein [Listeria monocytogenes]EIB7789509.1 phage tail tape measure protein [Listeria monocytogenes]MKQ29821.1 phage tail tape measure protein [Listeria monocytogenes]HDI4292480.1 phage tail tape measure protein [Listeria monocytogenes]
MAEKFGDLIATASLDINPFQTSARTLERQGRALGKNLKATEAMFKNTGKSIEGLKAKQQVLGKQLQVSSELVRKNTEKYNALKDATGDVNAATDEQKRKLLAAEQAMHKSVAEAESLRGKYNALSKEIALNSSKLVQSGIKMQALGTKMQNVGKGISSVGMGITTKFALPLAAGIGLSVKAASDFESAFAGVKKTVDEVVNQNGEVTYSYDKLAAGIRQMSKEMPASTTEISAVAEAAGQLGIQTPAILDFTKTMVNLGVATNMSSEEAATALARFANIVQMKQSDFDRLGATIVSLGNNFATTEKEITDMGLRLAGQGKQVNMSEADIMGLAAAMSSVGIEAEAGGTAMSMVMKKINNAVYSGKGSLKGFADLAGMSAKQFQKAWKDDAAGALDDVVHGLQKNSKEGKNLTAILNDLGIKGIRESDTMLRLSGNADILTDALGNSKTAWKENSALTDEASKRYETFESQLKIFKNQINDIAIDLGGPFMKALNAGLQASKPFLNSIKEMSEAFADATPETQKLVLKLAATALAFGPVTIGVGKFVSAGGTLIKATGSMVQGLGNFAVKAKLAKTGTDALAIGTVNAGKGAKVASVATRGFGASLGATLVTMGPWVLAIGAIGLAAYGLYKVFGDNNARKWGADIGDAADKSLSKVSQFSAEGTVAMESFSTDMSGNAKIVKTAFQGMADEVKKSVDDSIKALEESYNNLPEEVKTMYKKTLDEAKKDGEEKKKLAQTQADSAMKIVENAAKNERDLTETENKRLISLEKNLLSENVEALKLSSDEEKKVKAALYQDIEKMDRSQRVKSANALSKSMSEQKKAYEEQKENAKALYAEDGNTERYMSTLDILETKNKAVTESIAVRWVELERASGISESAIEDGLKNFGLSLEDIERISNETTKNTADNLGLLADESSDANVAWNDLILDDKTGEVTTNINDVISKAMSSEKEWKNLQFIIKEADLNSNAKATILDAVAQSGKWNQLSFEEKEILIESDSTRQIVLALEDNKKWNNLDYEVKKAILESNTPQKLDEVLKNYELWDEIPWDSSKKEAFLETNVDNTMQDVKKGFAEWDKAIPGQKNLIVDNNDVLNKILQSETVLVQYNNQTVDLKDLFANNSDVLNKVKKGNDVIVEYNGRKINLKELYANNRDLFNKVTSGKKVLYDYNGVPVNLKWLKMETNAGSVASQVQSAINNWQEMLNMRNKKIIEIAYKTNGKAPSGPQGLATGTNFHKGGLAVVNDARGANYQELITLPNGKTFLPYGRNVMLNLARGTKVLRGDKTAKILNKVPKFASGTTRDLVSKSKAVNIASAINSATENASLSKKQTGVSDEQKSNKVLLSQLKELVEQLIVVVQKPVMLGTVECMVSEGVLFKTIARFEKQKNSVQSRGIRGDLNV